MLHLQIEGSLCQQVPQKVKKLVAVLAISTLITEKKIEEKEELEQVPYIWYLVIFKDQTKALLDLRSKVNAVNQAFTYQLGLKT